MLDETIAGTLANAITMFGGWILTASMSSTKRRNKQSADIAQWFDTYQLSKNAPRQIAVSPEFGTGQLQEAIESNEVQAVLLELLCARMTAAPESDIAKIRDALASTMANRLAPYDTTEIVGSLFDYYDDEVCYLVGRLSGAMPDTFEKLREDAFNTRILAVLNAIQQHVASLTGRMDYVDEETYLTNYNRHIRDYHGKIQPPDSERRRRISINRLYVSPTIIPYDDSESSHSASGRPMILSEADRIAISALTLPALQKILDRTVLLGDPGGGKSTASNVLMYNHAIETDGRIPFLVVLRDLAGDNSANLSILTYIENKLDSLYQSKPPAGLIRRLLLSGRAIVIFDGLDELIDTSRRLEVTDVVEQFCTEYPLTSVLVTSRIVGYSAARLDIEQFTCYRLAGFNEEQTTEYVKKWFAQDDSIELTAVGQWTSSFLDESSAVPDLRSNPLMLALMCILYHGEGSIPRNRPEVYEQCAELLFRKWDTKRRINVELRARSLIEPAIRHLAFFLFTRDDGQSAVTERELTAETTSFLRSRGFESDEAATEASQQFIEFCRGRAWVFADAGTTKSGERLYTFTHRTFLEYFAASYLAINYDSPVQLAKILLSHVAKEEWDVVAELAIQKKDKVSDRGGERIIDTMLHEKRQRSARGKSNVLQFLARCVASIDLQPRVIRDVTRGIISFLLSGEPNQEVYFLPTSLALAWPIEKRDIVRDEITKHAADLINSMDQPTRKLGLRLASYIDAAMYAPRDEFPAEEIRRYWLEVVAASREAYKNQIIQASHGDPSMLRLALSEGYVTILEFLNQRNGDLSFLFSSVPLGIFATDWGGFFPMCLDTLEKEMILFPRRRAKEFPAIRDLGQYFKDFRPALPWMRSVPYESPFFHSELDEEFLRTMTETEVLGAAVILCSLMEMGVIDVKREHIIPWLLLDPYARVRLTGEPVKLLDLPVPSEFVALFKDWAKKRINFIVKTE